MNALRLHARVLRRLRQWLPPGLAEAVSLAGPSGCWPASPLAGRLRVGTEHTGCLRLQLDATLVADIRHQGLAALPAMDGEARWQPIGHRGLRFRMVLPWSRRVLLLDALRGQAWLLWREPGVARVQRGY